MKSSEKLKFAVGILTAVVLIAGIAYNSWRTKQQRAQIRAQRERRLLAGTAEEEKPEQGVPHSEEESEEKPESEKTDPADVPDEDKPELEPVSQQKPEPTEAEKPAVKEIKSPVKDEPVKEEDPKQKGWQLFFSDDFSDPDIKNRWEFFNGEWSVKNGELVGIGPQAHIAVLKKDIRGDVKIEFDCHIESTFLNDVSCFFSSKKANPGIRTCNTGYLLQYGGYSNTRNDIMKVGLPMREQSVSPLKKGVTYHMSAQRRDGVIKFSIDGEEILSMDEPDPLDGFDNCKIGLYAWGGDNYYDNVKIYVPKK